MVAATVLARAGELKQMLVAFALQPRYERAFAKVLAEHDDAPTGWDEERMMNLCDYFILEHRLANGRTVVEQFVDAHPELPPAEREMLLGWRDVVQGPFEVQRRDGPALVVVSLVDELTYRVRSNMGTSILRRFPARSFLVTRLVAVGDVWMVSGPTTVLRRAQRDLAYQLAVELSLRMPEAIYRNPEKLATAWEIQRDHRERFVRHFGSDLVVVPGGEAQEQVDRFWQFCRDDLTGAAPGAGRNRDGSAAPVAELPPELVAAETVALIYDEEDGLGFYADFGLVEAAFENPDLVRRRRYREMVLSYLHDDSVEPMVLRRLADRDPDKASTVFRRVLKRPRFAWATDGEALLRTCKPDYFDRPRLPQVAPLSDRLATYATSGGSHQVGGGVRPTLRRS